MLALSAAVLLYGAAGFPDPSDPELGVAQAQSATSARVRLSCPSGFSLNRAAGVCERALTEPATTRSVCVRGVLGARGRCWYSALETKARPQVPGALSCPSGGTLSGSLCTLSYKRRWVSTVYGACVFGTAAGSRCLHSKAARWEGPPSHGAYACDAGWTLRGSTCTRSTPRPIVRRGHWRPCAPFYRVSGSTCSRTYRATRAAATPGACPSGWSAASATKCQRTVRRSQAPNTVTGCKAGWSRTGSTCRIVIATRAPTRTRYCDPGHTLRNFRGTHYCITTTTTTTTTTTMSTVPEPEPTTPEPEPTTPEPTTPEPTTPEPTTPEPEPTTPEPEPTTSTVPEPEPTTSTVPPRCGAGEHAHNPEFGSGVHPRWVRDTQAHRDAHGGGDTPTGCHGDHAPLVRVQIDGYRGSTRTGPGTMTATFTVTPADATCSALLLGRIPRPVPGRTANRASISPRTGSGRTVTVEAAAIDDLDVYVYCTHATLEPRTKGADFVVLDVACSQTIAIRAQTAELTDQQWTTKCTSLKRGNDDTPYYAKRYTFELGAPSTVTIDVASAQNAYLILLSGHGADGPIEDFDNDSGQGTNAHLSVDLDSGDYTIEATVNTPRTGALARFSLEVSASTLTVIECPAGHVHLSEYEQDNDNGCRPSRCSPMIRDYSTGRCRSVPADQEKVYSFTEATIVGVRRAARVAMMERGSSVSCMTPENDPVTANMLAALMLSIPVHELAGGSHDYSPSPMTLSRWDHWNKELEINWKKRDDWNHPLYSLKERWMQPRAHWSPGVGLWQLDRWPKTIDLNHAERANVETGGKKVAEHFLDGLCKPDPLYNFGPWVACWSSSRCIDTYRDIYDEKRDSLFVKPTAGSSPDGGIQTRHCKWDVGGEIIQCYLYDMRRAEGTADRRYPDGYTPDSAWRKEHNSEQHGPHPNRTPLPAPFVSFTDDGAKYAVFSSESTGYDVTLIRAVPTGVEARLSTLGPDNNGWFTNTVDDMELFMETCKVSGAGAESGGIACEWTRM